MLALALKYRPNTWQDVVEQSSVCKILSRQIEINEIKNAYLFTGASGVGKTSLARLFAREVNNGKGNPIEIDAASNSGVDNVRQLIQEAKERAIDSKYKVIIIDECFTKDTLVNTPAGLKPISDINEGDTVFNLLGETKVIATHKKLVSNDRLVDVCLSNGKIITCTKEHLFFTNEGYIEAMNLRKGDELLVSENLRSMWSDFSSEKSQWQGLFKEMCRRDRKAESRLQEKPTDLYTLLCDLRERVDEHAYTRSEDLLIKLLLDPIITETETTLCIRGRNSTQEISLRKSKKGDIEVHGPDCRTTKSFFSTNEAKQSDEKQRNSAKNGGNKKKEWNVGMDGQEREKRAYNCSTADAIQCIRRFLGVGVSGEDALSSQERASLSYELQIRPCLSEPEFGSRGRWQFSQIERITTTGYKENNFTRTVRVESVKIHERGDSDRLGQGSDNYTEVYDLTVEGHPTYCVEDVLVHNCHSLSNQAWQAFLKCIEEPPKYTIFIFCTTDPQKIPDTIFSRVQRFNFTRVSANAIKERLAYICRSEGFTNYEESVDYISKIANGGLRSAISMLEKCVSLDTNLNINNVLKALGNYSYEVFFSLVNALIDGSEGRVLQIISEFYNDGHDLKLFVDQFLDFILNVCKFILFGNTTLTTFPNSFTDSLKNCTNFDNPQNYYTYLVDRVLELKNRLKNDSNPKSTIEASFLLIARGA